MNPKHYKISPLAHRIVWPAIEGKQQISPETVVARGEYYGGGRLAWGPAHIWWGAPGRRAPHPSPPMVCIAPMPPDGMVVDSVFDWLPHMEP